jgi:hypothetical protein
MKCPVGVKCVEKWAVFFLYTVLCPVFVSSAMQLAPVTSNPATGTAFFYHWRKDYRGLKMDHMRWLGVKREQVYGDWSTFMTIRRTTAWATEGIHHCNVWGNTPEFTRGNPVSTFIGFVRRRRPLQNRLQCCSGKKQMRGRNRQYRLKYQ